MLADTTVVSARTFPVLTNFAASARASSASRVTSTEPGSEPPLRIHKATRRRTSIYFFKGK
jgi:hypothetical protein